MMTWWQGSVIASLSGTTFRDIWNLKADPRASGSGREARRLFSQLCLTSEEGVHKILDKYSTFDISESSDMVLTLFSELDCRGQSAVVKDKEVNLTKAGVSFKVKVCSKQISYLRNTCNVQTYKVSGCWGKSLDPILYWEIPRVPVFSWRWKTWRPYEPWSPRQLQSGLS